MYEIRDSLSELFETSDLAVAFDFREPGWTARGALGSRCVWAADIGMCPLGFWASKRGAAFGAACKYTDRADTLLERVFLRCVAFGAELLARPTPRPAPTRKLGRHWLAKVWKPARNGHQTQHNEEKPVERDRSAILLQHGAEKRA